MAGFIGGLGVAFDVKDMMLLQLALEGLLVILFLVLLRRSKKSKDDPAHMPSNLKTTIERFLSESEKISAAFEANLKDKKDLSADLILKLDRRVADYRLLLQKTEAAFHEAQKKLSDLNQPLAKPVLTPESDKANPAAPEVRALVLQLAKKGLNTEEIAARAKLHRGEVELIIDLERQFNL